MVTRASCSSLSPANSGALIPTEQTNTVAGVVRRGSTGSVVTRTQSPNVGRSMTAGFRFGHDAIVTVTGVLGALSCTGIVTPTVVEMPLASGVPLTTTSGAVAMSPETV